MLPRVHIHGRMDESIEAFFDQRRGDIGADSMVRAL